MPDKSAEKVRVEPVVIWEGPYVPVRMCRVAVYDGEDFPEKQRRNGDWDLTVWDLMPETAQRLHAKLASK